MKKNIVLIWMLWFSFSGCSDFLQEESHELMYARTSKDLEELLIGNGYMMNALPPSSGRPEVSLKSKTAYYPWLHVMDDDVQAAVAGQQRDACSVRRLEGFYQWHQNPFNDLGSPVDDITWSKLYEHIAVINVILNKVEEFTHDPEEERNSVKGQCYFLRAAYYYLLVNFYAKPYDPVTASGDLGVPLKLSPVVEDQNFTRTSVDSVYNQIVVDLKSAIDCLEGITMKTYNRTNEHAARLLLSRVYCYMGKWELVPGLCREILEGGYSLKDLTLSDPGKWLQVDSPEIIFTQGTNSSLAVFEPNYNNASYGSFAISPDLESVLKEEEGDCRFDMLAFQEYDFNIPRKLTGKDTTMVNSMIMYLSDCFLLRLPEVYLNLAEALVMTGDEPGAREALMTLMEKRITTVRTLTESGEDLVKLVRKERRRELCFEGQRWFDLRRYAVSPKFPESIGIKHDVYEFNAGNASLKGTCIGYYLLPGYPDGGWVLPIPAYDIEETDGALVDNERGNCLFYEN